MANETIDRCKAGRGTFSVDAARWFQRRVSPPVMANETIDRCKAGRVPPVKAHMIAVIDYEMGNLGSVSKALECLGAKVKVTQDPLDLKKADKIVLPGVGAFKDAMNSLKRFRLLEPLKAAIEAEKPYLGICLGLELLFDQSEEGGFSKGMGILGGDAVRFNDGLLKVPHIGWNQLRKKMADCPLFRGIDDNEFFYFVHSYYVRPKDESIVAAATDYGAEFTSMIWKDNIYAVQFHPEKSQATGLKFLKNFIGL